MSLKICDCMSTQKHLSEKLVYCLIANCLIVSGVNHTKTESGNTGESFPKS